VGCYLEGRLKGKAGRRLEVQLDAAPGKRDTAKVPARVPLSGRPRLLWCPVVLPDVCSRPCGGNGRSGLVVLRSDVSLFRRLQVLGSRGHLRQAFHTDRRLPVLRPRSSRSHSYRAPLRRRRPFQASSITRVSRSGSEAVIVRQRRCSRKYKIRVGPIRPLLRSTNKLIA